MMLERVPLVCRGIVVGVLAIGGATLVSATAWGITIGAPQLIGINSSSALAEVSGLVESRANPNALWVHNDSGDSARFFAMSRQGNLLGAFALTGATARDWEDIAIGPKLGGGNYLYLGDIGDNDAVRSFITVYRTDEPQSTTGATIPPGGYSTLNLQFPGGPCDAESLFVDPQWRWRPRNQRVGGSRCSRWHP